MAIISKNTTIKKPIRNLSVEEMVIANVRSTIRLRQEEPLRITNSVLIKFFWEVGQLITENLTTGKQEKYVLKEVCDTLTNSFGMFFTPENVSIMMTFSSNCSKETIEKIAPYISWKYIPVLKNVTKYEEWIFYVRSLSQEKTTPEALKKRLLDNSFQKSQPIRLKFPDFPFHDLIARDRELLTLPVDNYFTQPLLYDFQLFFEPTTNNRSPKMKSLAVVSGRIVEEIERRITTIQRQYNSHFNLRFNLSLWEIGREIMRVSSEIDMKDNKLLKLIAANLQHSYGDFFNEMRLNNSMLFAQQFPDPLSSIQFASLIKWEHIQILLPIADLSEKLFYANIVAKFGLTELELKDCLQNKVYNNFKEKDFEKLSKLPYFNSVSGKLGEFQVILQNNNNESRVVSNIFENYDFLKFVSLFDKSF